MHGRGWRTCSLGTLDLTTGVVTPIVTGLMGPGGMVFVNTAPNALDYAPVGSKCDDQD